MSDEYHVLLQALIHSFARSLIKFSHNNCLSFVITKLPRASLIGKPMKQLLLPLILILALTGHAQASKILIPMDDSQKNHLKAQRSRF